MPRQALSPLSEGLRRSPSDGPVGSGPRRSRSQRQSTDERSSDIQAPNTDLKRSKKSGPSGESLTRAIRAMSASNQAVSDNGQRVGEVAGITPNEIDLPKAVWNIPCVADARTAIRIRFPSRPWRLRSSGEGALAVISRQHVSDTICDHQDLFGLDRWTAHDLRRTALTKMAELGVAPIVLGHIANHRTTTKAGVTLGVYVQHQYEREKRDALELWADRLQGIISGGADVVAIRRAWAKHPRLLQAESGLKCPT